MSNLIFDEDQRSVQTRPSRIPGRSGLVGFLIRKGWAKNNQQAMLILIVTFIVCAIFLAVFYWPESSNTPTPSPAEIEEAGGPNDPGVYGDRYIPNR